MLVGHIDDCVVSDESLGNLHSVALCGKMKRCPTTVVRVVGVSSCPQELVNQILSAVYHGVVQSTPTHRIGLRQILPCLQQLFHFG